VARRAAAHEWEKLRELRLRALSDAPEAFASTLAESAARSADEWRERFLPRAGSVNVVEVDDDGSFVGIASGFADDESPEVVYLVGMFVVPERRGRGLGRRLVGAVESGFRPTGTSRSLPDRPEITVVELVKEL